MGDSDASLAQSLKRTCRAKEACVICRQRKVRCDVYFLGAPCTNCVHAGLKCLLQMKKHKRKAVVPATNIYPPNVRSTKQLNELIQNRAATTLVENVFDSATSTTEDVGSNGSNQGGQSVHQEFLERTHVDPKIPDYVTWNHDQMSSEQRRDVLASGALSLPELATLNYLIESYIDWVHPQLPFLDLSGFLTAMNSNGDSSQLSLLLLYAVLYAGALYVNINDPVLAKYDNLRELKAELKVCAKVLYEVGYEKDLQILMQATLLLSLDSHVDFQASDESQSWLEASLMTFRDWVALQPEKEIWDQTSLCFWWSLYIINNSIGFRDVKTDPSAFQIGEIPLPSLTKFGNLINIKGMSLYLKGSNLLTNPDQQTLLCQMVIQRWRLQKMISKIIEEVNEVGILQHRPIKQKTAVKPENHGQDVARLFSKWDTELDKWWCELPYYASDLKSAFHPSDSTAGRLLSFHLAITATEFFSMCNSIYSLLMNMESPASFFVLAIKHKKSMNSARLLDMISAMDERDVPRYLLNNGLKMTEWALQLALNSSQLSTTSNEVAGLVFIMKQLLDIRVNTAQDAESLTWFMKLATKDSIKSNVLPDDDDPESGPHSNHDRGNNAYSHTDSPGSAFPSSMAPSLPDEVPDCYSGVSEDLQPLFADYNGYDLSSLDFVL